jgi:hypothetical protein
MNRTERRTVAEAVRRATGDGSERLTHVAEVIRRNVVCGERKPLPVEFGGGTSNPVEIECWTARTIWTSDALGETKFAVGGSSRAEACERYEDYMRTLRFGPPDFGRPTSYIAAFYDEGDPELRQYRPDDDTRPDELEGDRLDH